MVFYQLLCHLAGDFFLQSDWMAGQKYTKKSVALLHAVVYTLPFLLLSRNPWALGIICLTHAVINHYKVANYVAWAKNWLAPKHLTLSKTGYLCPKCGARSTYEGTPGSIVACPKCDTIQTKDDAVSGESYRARVRPWVECKATGYDPDRPIWLTVWLGIITDNSLHIAINFAALRYFP